MDGVKALAVLASVYYPGDGIVAKDNYQTSSGERYDQSAPPKARPVEAEVATRSGTDPMDATVKPPTGYDSDRSSRPLPSDDGPKHLYQSKRTGAARLRAHTPSVALGNSPQGYARGLFSLPPR